MWIIRLLHLVVIMKTRIGLWRRFAESGLATILEGSRES